MNADLFEQFGRIEWLLHRLHQQGHRAHGPLGDPHRGQGRILAMLKMQPGISQKDLSYLLDIRPQSLGELLVKLERGGYIVRTQSEADRRVMDIRLTDAGVRAAQQPFDWGGVFDCLSAEEQEALSGYLQRIIAALEGQLAGDPAADWDEEGPEDPPCERPFARRRGPDFDRPLRPGRDAEDLERGLPGRERAFGRRPGPDFFRSEFDGRRREGPPPRAGWRQDTAGPRPDDEDAPHPDPDAQ